MHLCGVFFFPFNVFPLGKQHKQIEKGYFLCAQSFCRNASDTSMLVSGFIFTAAARVNILLLIFKPRSSSSNSLENPEMRPPPPLAAEASPRVTSYGGIFFWQQMPLNTPWSAAWTACSVETQGKTGTTNMVYKCLGSTAESLTVTEPDFFPRELRRAQRTALQQDIYWLFSCWHRNTLCSGFGK